MTPQPKEGRYLPIPEPEHADDLGPDGGFYCTDCVSYPFVAFGDIEEHDRSHVEQAARRDPDQSPLYEEVCDA